ncbi:MAG: hypothetical protein J7J76_08765 [Candidatus Latescibacteria bacterium]|nr:hypothetical protein [Candidatus Latescibacterota bacterium]
MLIHFGNVGYIICPGGNGLVSLSAYGDDLISSGSDLVDLYAIDLATT